MSGERCGLASDAIDCQMEEDARPHPLSMDKSWAVRVCTRAALGVTLFAILGGGSSACVDRYLVWNGRGTCAFEK